MVIFLLVFAITLGALAFGGYKLSKAAAKAKIKQIREIQKELDKEEK